MDDKLDRLLQSTVASQAAQQFMLDYLLNAHFVAIPRSQRLEIAKALLDASTQTEFLSGVTKGDDFASARLADMIVEFQEHVDQAVGRALAKVAQVEDARLAQLGREDRDQRDETD